MSDFPELFPMDFLGAAQSEGAPAIIYISSDEDERMDSFDGDSVDDVNVSSEEEIIVRHRNYGEMCRKTND